MLHGLLPEADERISKQHLRLAVSAVTLHQGLHG
jgi:hypothetical protein